MAYKERDIDKYIKEQKGEVEDNKSSIIKKVRNEFPSEAYERHLTQGSSSPKFEQGFLTSEIKPGEEKLNDYELEKVLESRQASWQKARNAFGQMVFKSIGYGLQGLAGIQDSVEGWTGTDNSLLESPNKLYEWGNDVKEWAEETMPLYRKNPDLPEGEADFGDFTTYLGMASDSMAQMIPNIALAKGMGKTLGKVAPRFITKDSSSIVKGIPTAVSLAAMNHMNAKQTELQKLEELRERYKTNPEYFRKLYGRDLEPRELEHEFEKAGNLTYYSTFALNGLTNLAVSKFLASPTLDIIRQTKEGITKANLPKSITKDVLLGLGSEAGEEWAETMIEKSADELMRQKTTNSLGSSLWETVTGDGKGDLYDTSAKYVEAFKDGFIKNATSDEAKLSLLGGLFGGFVELGGSGALSGGDNSYRRLIKNQKVAEEFFKSATENAPEGSMFGMFNKHLDNSGKMLFELDPKVREKRDSVTNVVSPLTQAFNISMNNKGVDVLREHTQYMTQLLDTAISTVTKPDGKLDPNSDEAKLLKPLMNDESLNAKINAEKDENKKKTILIDALQEQKSHLTTFLDSMDDLRTIWEQGQEAKADEDITLGRMNAYMSAKVVDKILNTNDLKNYNQSSQDFQTKVRDSAVNSLHKTLSKFIEENKDLNNIDANGNLTKESEDLNKELLKNGDNDRLSQRELYHNKLRSVKPEIDNFLNKKDTDSYSKLNTKLAELKNTKEEEEAFKLFTTDFSKNLEDYKKEISKAGEELKKQEDKLSDLDKHKLQISKDLHIKRAKALKTFAELTKKVESLKEAKRLDLIPSIKEKIRKATDLFKSKKNKAKKSFEEILRRGKEEQDIEDERIKQEQQAKAAKGSPNNAGGGSKTQPPSQPPASPTTPSGGASGVPPTNTPVNTTVDDEGNVADDDFSLNDEDFSLASTAVETDTSPSGIISEFLILNNAQGVQTKILIGDNTNNEMNTIRPFQIVSSYFNHITQDVSRKSTVLDIDPVSVLLGFNKIQGRPIGYTIHPDRPDTLLFFTKSGKFTYNPEINNFIEDKGSIDYRFIGSMKLEKFDESKKIMLPSNVSIKGDKINYDVADELIKAHNEHVQTLIDRKLNSQHDIIILDSKHYDKDDNTPILNLRTTGGGGLQHIPISESVTAECFLNGSVSIIEVSANGVGKGLTFYVDSNGNRRDIVNASHGRKSGKGSIRDLFSRVLRLSNVNTNDADFSHYENQTTAQVLEEAKSGCVALVVNTKLGVTHTDTNPGFKLIPLRPVRYAELSKSETIQNNHANLVALDLVTSSLKANKTLLEKIINILDAKQGGDGVLKVIGMLNTEGNPKILRPGKSFIQDFGYGIDISEGTDSDNKSYFTVSTINGNREIELYEDSDNDTINSFVNDLLDIIKETLTDSNPTITIDAYVIKNLQELSFKDGASKTKSRKAIQHLLELDVFNTNLKTVPLLENSDSSSPRLHVTGGNLSLVAGKTHIQTAIQNKALKSPSPQLGSVSAANPSIKRKAHTLASNPPLTPSPSMAPSPVVNEASVGTQAQVVNNYYGPVFNAPVRVTGDLIINGGNVGSGTGQVIVGQGAEAVTYDITTNPDGSVEVVEVNDNEPGDNIFSFDTTLDTINADITKNSKSNKYKLTDEQLNLSEESKAKLYKAIYIIGEVEQILRRRNNQARNEATDAELSTIPGNLRQASEYLKNPILDTDRILNKELSNITNELTNAITNNLPNAVISELYNKLKELIKYSKELNNEATLKFRENFDEFIKEYELGIYDPAHPDYIKPDNPDDSKPEPVNPTTLEPAEVPDGSFNTTQVSNVDKEAISKIKRPQSTHQVTNLASAIIKAYESNPKEIAPVDIITEEDFEKVELVFEGVFGEYEDSGSSSDLAPTQLTPTDETFEDEFYEELDEDFSIDVTPTKVTNVTPTKTKDEELQDYYEGLSNESSSDNFTEFVDEELGTDFEQANTPTTRQVIVPTVIETQVIDFQQFYRFGKNKQHSLTTEEQALLIEHLASYYLTIYPDSEGHLDTLQKILNFEFENPYYFINYLESEGIDKSDSRMKDLLDSIDTDFTDIFDNILKLQGLQPDSDEYKNIVDNTIKTANFNFIKELEKKLASISLPIKFITLTDEDLKLQGVFDSYNNTSEYYKDEENENEEGIDDIETEQVKDGKSISQHTVQAFNAIKSASSKVKAILSYIPDSAGERNILKGLKRFHKFQTVSSVLYTVAEGASDIKDFDENLKQLSLETGNRQVTLDINNRLQSVRKLDESAYSEIFVLYNKLKRTHILAMVTEEDKFVELDEEGRPVYKKVVRLENSHGGNLGKRLANSLYSSFLSRRRLSRGLIDIDTDTRIIIPVSTLNKDGYSLKQLQIVFNSLNLRYSEGLDESVEQGVIFIKELVDKQEGITNKPKDYVYDNLRNDKLFRKGLLLGSSSIVKNRLQHHIPEYGNRLPLEVIDNLFSNIKLTSKRLVKVGKERVQDSTSILDIKNRIKYIVKFFVPQFKDEDLEGLLLQEVLNKNTGKAYSDISDLASDLIYTTFYGNIHPKPVNEDGPGHYKKKVNILTASGISSGHKTEVAIFRNRLLPFYKQASNMSYILASYYTNRGLKTPVLFKDEGKQYSELNYHDQMSITLSEIKNAKDENDPNLTKYIDELYDTYTKNNRWLVNMVAGKLLTLDNPRATAIARTILENYHGTSTIDFDIKIEEAIDFYRIFKIDNLHSLRRKSKRGSKKEVKDISPFEREILGITWFFENFNNDNASSRTYSFIGPTLSDRETILLFRTNIVKDDRDLENMFNNMKKMDTDRISLNRRFIEEKVSLMITNGADVDGLKRDLYLQDILDVGKLEPAKPGEPAKPFSKHYEETKNRLEKEKDLVKLDRLSAIEAKYQKGFVQNATCQGKTFIEILRFLEHYNTVGYDNEGKTINKQGKKVDGIIGLTPMFVKNPDMTYEEFKSKLIEDKILDLKKLSKSRKNKIGKTGKPLIKRVSAPSKVRNLIEKIKEDVKLSKTEREDLFVYEANYLFNSIAFQTMFGSVESFKGNNPDSIQVEISKRNAGLSAPRDRGLVNDNNRFYNQLIIEDCNIDISNSTKQDEELAINIFTNLAHRYDVSESGIKSVNNIDTIRGLLKDASGLSKINITDNDKKGIIKAIENLKAFTTEGIKSTDAQEYQTLEEALTVAISYGKISEEEAGLPSAHELMNGIIREGDNYGDYDPSAFDGYKEGLWYHLQFGTPLPQNLQAKFSEGSVLDLVMKFVYTNKTLEAHTPVLDYIKSATVTLHPSITKGTKLDTVRRLLNLKGIQRACFNSTRKGLHGFAYNILDGQTPKDIRVLEAMLGPTEGNPHILKFDRSYLGLQKSLKNKQDTKVTFASQVFKVFKSLAKGEDKSHITDILNECDDLMKAIVIEQSERLQQEIGIDKLGNIKDPAVFANKIKEEVSKRNLGEYLNEYLQIENGRFIIPPMLSPVADRIEVLMTSMMNNRVMSWDMLGGNFTMVSELLFRKKPGGDSSILICDKDSQYHKHGSLGFDEVLVSYPFDNMPETQEELDKVIENNPEFKQLLKILGYRTPCQGPNSISKLKIVGFLPKKLKNTAICNHSFMVKSGCDFDADTLYFYKYEHDSKNNIKDSNKNKLLKNYFKLCDTQEFQEDTYLPNGPGPIHRLSEVITELYPTQSSLNAYTSIAQRSSFHEGVIAKGGVSTFTSFIGGAMKEAHETKSEKFPNKIRVAKILDNIQYFQSASVDNQKYGILGKINVNNNTFSAICAMLYEGYTIEEVVTLINIPGVREVVDRLNSGYVMEWNQTLERVISDYLTPDELKDFNTFIANEPQKSEYSIDNLKESEVFKKLKYLSIDYLKEPIIDNLSALKVFYLATIRGRHLQVMFNSKNVQTKKAGKGLSGVIDRVIKFRKLEESKEFFIGKLDETMHNEGVIPLLNLTTNMQYGALTSNFNGILLEVIMDLNPKSAYEIGDIKQEWEKFLHTILTNTPREEYIRLLHRDSGLAKNLDVLQYYIGDDYFKSNSFLSKLNPEAYDSDSPFREVSFDRGAVDSDYVMDDIARDFLKFSNDNLLHIFGEDGNIDARVVINQVNRQVSQEEIEKFQLNDDQSKVDYWYKNFLKLKESIVKDLVLYAYLVTPTGPHSFKNLIPIQVLRKQSVLEMFNVAGDRLYKSSELIRRFKRNYLINNPDKAHTNVDIPKDLTILDAKEGDILTIKITDTDILPFGVGPGAVTAGVSDGSYPKFLLIQSNKEDDDKSILVEAVTSTHYTKEEVKYLVIKNYNVEDRLDLISNDGGLLESKRNFKLDKPIPFAIDFEVPQEITEELENIKDENKEEFRVILDNNNISSREFFNKLIEQQDDTYLKKFLEILNQLGKDEVLDNLIIMDCPENRSDFEKILITSKGLSERDKEKLLEAYNEVYVTDIMGSVLRNKPSIVQLSSGFNVLLSPQIHKGPSSNQIFDGLKHKLVEELFHHLDTQMMKDVTSTMPNDGVIRKGLRIVNYGVDENNVKLTEEQLIIEIDELIKKLIDALKNYDLKGNNIRENTTLSYLESQVELLTAYKACLQSKDKYLNSIEVGNVKRISEEVNYSLSNFFEFKARVLTDKNTTNLLIYVSDKKKSKSGYEPVMGKVKKNLISRVINGIIGQYRSIIKNITDKYNELFGLADTYKGLESQASRDRFNGVSQHLLNNYILPMLNIDKIKHLSASVRKYTDDVAYNKEKELNAKLSKKPIKLINKNKPEEIQGSLFSTPIRNYYNKQVIVEDYTPKEQQEFIKLLNKVITIKNNNLKGVIGRKQNTAYLTKLQRTVEVLSLSYNYDMLAEVLRNELNNIKKLLNSKNLSNSAEIYITQSLKQYDAILDMYQETIAKEGSVPTLANKIIKVNEMLDEQRGEIAYVKSKFEDIKNKRIIEKVLDYINTNFDDEAKAHLKERYIDENTNNLTQAGFNHINGVWSYINDITRAEHPLAQLLTTIQNNIKVEVKETLNDFQDELLKEIDDLKSYCKTNGLTIEDVFESLIDDDGLRLVGEESGDLINIMNSLRQKIYDAPDALSAYKAIKNYNKELANKYAIQINRDEEQRLFKLRDTFDRMLNDMLVKDPTLSSNSEFLRAVTNLRSIHLQYNNLGANGSIIVSDEYHEGKYSKYLETQEELMEMYGSIDSVELLEMINTNISTNDPISYFHDVINSKKRKSVFNGENYIQTRVKNPLDINPKYETIQSIPEVKKFYDYYKKELLKSRAYLPDLRKNTGERIDSLYIPEIPNSFTSNAISDFERDAILESSKNIIKAAFRDELYSISERERTPEQAIPVKGFSRAMIGEETPLKPSSIVDALVHFKMYSEQYNAKSKYLSEAQAIVDAIEFGGEDATGNTSNLELTARHFVNSFFYGISEEQNSIPLPIPKYFTKKEQLANEARLKAGEKAIGGRTYTLSRLLDWMVAWSRRVGLSMSSSLAMADIYGGFMQNLREAARGRSFSYGSLIKAYQEVLWENKAEYGAFGSGIILGGVGFSPLPILGAFVGNKFLSGAKGRINEFAKLLGVENRTNESAMLLKSNYIKRNYGKFKITKDDFFIMQEMSGKLNAYSTMVAYLKNKRITLDIGAGSIEISAYELLDEDGNNRYDTINPEQRRAIISQLTREVNNIIGNVHGNYDMDKPILLNKYMLGRVISAFRSWLWRGLEQRFSGFKSLNGENIEGNYLTTFKALGSGIKSIKTDYDKRGVSFTIKEIGRKLLYHSLMNPFNIKRDSSWAGSLTQIEKENIRMTIVEVAVSAALLRLGVGILWFAKETGLDDEEDNNAVEQIAYQNLRRFYAVTNKAKKEVDTYISVEEFNKTISNPVSVARLFVNLNEFSEASADFAASYANMNDEPLRVEKGQHKGDYKIMNELFQLIPGSAMDRDDLKGLSLKEVIEREKRKERKRLRAIERERAEEVEEESEEQE